MAQQQNHLRTAAEVYPAAFALLRLQPGPVVHLALAAMLTTGFAVLHGIVLNDCPLHDHRFGHSLHQYS